MTIDICGTRQALLNQSYQSLKNSVYAGLVLQTRLTPYLDSIELNVSDTGIALDYAPMTARLDTQKGADAPAAVMDLLELQRFAGGQLNGWNGFAQLESWLADPVGGAALQATLVAAGVIRNGTWSGTGGADMAVGGNGNDTLSGDTGEDFLVGGGGNDVLNGDNDTLYGGAGNDLLLSGTRNDKSRRWRNGKRKTFRVTANDSEFEMRSVG